MESSRRDGHSRTADARQHRHQRYRADRRSRSTISGRSCSRAGATIRRVEAADFVSTSRAIAKLIRSGPNWLRQLAGRRERALRRFGIRCVIAPGFGNFLQQCRQTGPWVADGGGDR